MPKKVLFVSSFIGQANTGGAVASKRNLALCQLFFPDSAIDAFGFAFPGSASIDAVILLPSYAGKLQTFLSYLLGFTGGLTYRNFIDIKKHLAAKHYSYIFLDGSLLGKLALFLNKYYPSITIILFCHNVESDFFKAAAKSNKLYTFLFIKASLAERNAIKCADRVLVFNLRDANRLVELYRIPLPLIFPITVTDKFDPALVQNEKTNQLQLLFIGSSFYANIEGIKWFCKNVMPYVNAHLHIVGNGMNNLVNELSGEKISITGSVDFLDPFYYKSDAVVIPIFSGSGMKVKTAEALMMGKTIFGTNEAWEGYNFSNSGGWLCNNADEFIAAINAFMNGSKLKFNFSARKLFLSQYSDFSLQQSIADFKSTL